MFEITSETAESFRFSLQQFFKLEALTDQGGVRLADGGWLIPSNDLTAGKEEFYRYSKNKRKQSSDNLLCGATVLKSILTKKNMCLNIR